jgi:hypothetical protein
MARTKKADQIHLSNLTFRLDAKTVLVNLETPLGVVVLSLSAQEANLLASAIMRQAADLIDAEPTQG